MPFPLNILASRNQQPSVLLTTSQEDYDSSDSTGSETPKSCFRTTSLPEVRDREHVACVASTSSSLAPGPSYRGSSDFLRQPSGTSSAAPSPIPSRSASPLPQFYASAPSSSCTSDADSEPTSPLLHRNRRSRWWTDDQRWWTSSHREGRRKRRRRGNWYSARNMKRLIRTILRHPLFPTQPTSILLTLLVFTIFAILLTLLLIHILNPDKEPLPWRAYCSIPSGSSAPPSLSAATFSPGYPYNSLSPSDVSSLSSVAQNTFPPPNLDEYSPAGIFLGVFTMDSAIERRMLIRSTWASHERSRNGAGPGDGGMGTSRTIVRFVLGKPRSSYEEKVQLEAETYKDMIILPISENMNSGKTHAFFTWASTEAWVPPVPSSFEGNHTASYSYSSTAANFTIPVAKHDPKHVRMEWKKTGTQTPWVRPDFVSKVDDDSFVMLAELEARLRIELHAKTRASHDDPLRSRQPDADDNHSEAQNPDIHVTDTADPIANTTAALYERQIHAPNSVPIPPSPRDDPLVYWGYLVKNQFMAGELYSLSWSIVKWVAKDLTVKGLTRGKEDKQVAKWMRIHPRHSEVRWKSERCWIYDHPRAGTVYSHGFLFPSEITRIRKAIQSYLGYSPSLSDDNSAGSSDAVFPVVDDYASPMFWAYSSVSTFGVRYSPPLSNLTTPEGVEALVEGSSMSNLREGGEVTALDAWRSREGRRRRYEDQRVGGTIVVHFVKKNNWYLETALALLEGDEETSFEKSHYPDSDELQLGSTLLF